LGSINDQAKCFSLPEHLALVIDKCKCNLNESQNLAVEELILKNAEAFASSKNDLGYTDIIQHQVNTGNALPVKQNPRRIPLSIRQEVNDELQRMMDNEIIRPSISPWSSQIVVVRKRDNPIRLCIDFRRVNELTVKDSFTLPRIEDCLDALRGILGFQHWILPVATIKLACPLVIPRKHRLLRIKGYLNLPVCLLVYAMLGQPFPD
jgi:hypothetical protein